MCLHQTLHLLEQALLDLSQSSCCQHAGTHCLVSFSKVPMMLRGMAPGRIRVRNSEYLQSCLAQDVKALDDISSWSSWWSFKVLVGINK